MKQQWLADWKARMTALFGRRWLRSRADEEMRLHLEMLEQRLIDEGVPAGEARKQARRRFGNPSVHRESTLDAWRYATLGRLGQDLHYAIRTMGRARAFTAVTVLSVALGIGATTAVYSLLEAILFRPLPVPEPESLVVMKWHASKWPDVAHSFSTFSHATYWDVDDRVTGSVFPRPALDVFQDSREVLESAFCYFAVEDLTVSTAEDAEPADGLYVSGDYFRGLGVAPSAGRLILPEDDRPGAPSTIVLSHAYSQRLFGEPAAAIGKSVHVNEAVFTVVGVTPPGFQGTVPGLHPDVYLSLESSLQLGRPEQAAAAAAQLTDRNYYMVEIMGRLREGVTLPEAQSALQQRFANFLAATASGEDELASLPVLNLIPGSRGPDGLRHDYGEPLQVLMGMACLLLLIACVNVANLMLARAGARQREIAVRLGMGAGRFRIIRQLLTESVVLSAAGGLLGLIVAFWGIGSMTLLFASGGNGFALDASLNANVLGIATVVTVLTGLLFGLAPAIRATCVDLAPALKQSRAGLAPAGKRSLLSRAGPSRVLVSLQVAISLVLLVSAGLFVRTLRNLHAIDLGFSRDNILLFDVDPGAVGYSGPALAALYRELSERLGAIPGVQSVSYSNQPLLSGSGSATRVTTPEPPSEAEPAASGLPFNYAGLFRVGPDFFATMQIPLVAGREFADAGEAGSPPPVIVNERFTRQFGYRDPVGAVIELTAGRFQIVGVVSDALLLQLKNGKPPVVYMPTLTEDPPSHVSFAIRTVGAPLAHAGSIRDVVRQVAPRLAVANLRTNAAFIDSEIHQEIALARLCTVFALVALLLAAVGLYGIVSFHTVRRTGEIGIRMALGAQRTGIVWLVVRDLMVVGIVGLLIGEAAVAAGTRYVESFLYGIGPTDPATVAGAAALLLAVAAAAAFRPARKAARISPVAALRYE